MSAPEFGEWLPIETADTTTTRDVLLCDGGDIRVGYLDRYKRWSIEGNYRNPTHWMPLPPPPKVTP